MIVDGPVAGFIQLETTEIIVNSTNIILNIFFLFTYTHTLYMWNVFTCECVRNEGGNTVKNKTCHPSMLRRWMDT